MSSTNSSRAVLSKSTFIRGMQCVKSLYLHKKRPFLRDPLSAEQRAVFARGTKVGIYARQLFPGGVDAAPKSHFQMAASAVKTAEYIAAGETVIYEAAFQYDGVIIALDILVKEPDGWKAIEVKSSLMVSDTYLWDAALQYHVITGNGIQLNEFAIAHIDGNYVKQGNLEPGKLYRLQSVLEQVKERSMVVAQKVSEFKEVINLSSSPLTLLGSHCNKPYPCDFLGHCWKKVSRGSVFQLKGLTDERKFDLFHQGVGHVSDLPADEIIPDHWVARQVLSIQEDRVIADHEKLQCLMTKVKAPMAFFSILWQQPALPPFDGVRPYECLPYSLGISFRGASMQQPLCLVAPPGALMDLTMVKQLVDALAEVGSIMVFDQERLMGILRNLATGNQDLQTMIDHLETRMVDLQAPFMDNTIIWPHMLKYQSPEAILRSMKKKVPLSNIKPATFLEATLLYQQLMVTEDLSLVDSGGQSICQYHKGALLTLEQLWETLTEISQMAD